MGGSGKGSGAKTPWAGFTGGGGGGQGREVNVMRPGGGKPMRSTTDSNIPWPKRVTGEQQPQTQTRPGGGTAQAMTPESIAMMKSIAKYAALGMMAGPAGTAAGGAYGAWKERSKQREFMKGVSGEGAPHIYNHGEKRMGADLTGTGSDGSSLLGSSEDEDNYQG